VRVLSRASSSAFGAGLAQSARAIAGSVKVASSSDRRAGAVRESRAKRLNWRMRSCQALLRDLGRIRQSGAMSCTALSVGPGERQRSSA